MDPYEDFKKVFERFASAEEVTGMADLSTDDEVHRPVGWGD